MEGDNSLESEDEKGITSPPITEQLKAVALLKRVLEENSVMLFTM